MINIYVDKLIAEDNYEQGEIETAHYLTCNELIGKACNIQTAIEKTAAYTNCKPELMLFDTEQNIIICQVMENADGNEPSDTELEMWKHNGCKMFAVTYTVKLMEEVEIKITKDMYKK